MTFIMETNPRKYGSFVCFLVKFWTLYRSDDGLNDGPDVVK
jgi:hypothetical protein